jgi:hypothetical protein
MATTTNIIPAVVEALRSHIALVVFGGNFASVSTGYDYRHVDEERDGILGLHLPVPACIVSEVEGGSSHAVTRMSVVVRHDQEVSTIDEHTADARTVTDAMYALSSSTFDADITDSLTKTFTIVPTSFSPISTTKEGRGFETRLEFSVVVA